LISFFLLCGKRQRLKAENDANFWAGVVFFPLCLLNGSLSEAKLGILLI